MSARPKVKLYVSVPDKLVLASYDDWLLRIGKAVNKAQRSRFGQWGTDTWGNVEKQIDPVETGKYYKANAEYCRADALARDFKALMEKLEDSGH